MSAPYLGDFPEDFAGLTFFWSSNAIAGESITRATNGTISVYKDGGTSQSTAGVTDTEDFDSLTGVHKVLIDTSADAFYAAGSEYAVILSAATIDGKTINAPLAHFSIERAGGVLALLKGGTNGLAAIKTAIVAVDDFVDTEIADIQSRLPAALVSGRMDSSVGAMAANTFTASALATSAVDEIVDAVWDEATAGHTTAGTTGKALTDAGSAGDPWSTALPGAYGAGTAGKIVGDNINATISSRASQTSLDTVDDFLDTEVAAVLAAVDTEVAAILADTNELQTDWVDGGRLDLILDARASQTSVDTLDNFVDTEIADIQARLPSALVSGRMDSNIQAGATGVISATLLAADAANEIADALLDRADAIESGLTLRQAHRLEAAAAAGKLSGAATTTVTIRNAVADAKARITATVDADGNRSAITTDVT